MILRDPVHGLVSFDRPAEQVVVRLLDTRELQRLRRIRMLGVTSLAFPGAEHSRFAHAVGAAHVMTCFLHRLRALCDELPSHERLSLADEQVALAAALTHDLGHGPLSHLFEEVFPGGEPHEHWTSALLLDPDSQVHRELAAIASDLPARAERLVHGEHERPYLAHAVSGTFDVDRCDYLLRDSYMTGVRYGLYDLDWLLRSLRLAPRADGALVLAVDGSKGLPAVEGFFLARLFMYQQVYFHKAARAAECMIRAVFLRAADLVAAGGTDAGLPPVLLAMARGETVTAHAYGSIDDGTVWGTLEQWDASSRDPVLRDLAARVRQRALFKTATLDDDHADVEELGHGLREIVRAAGFDPRYYAHVDVAETVPYAQPGEDVDGLQVVYQHRAPRPLGRASFLLGRLRGEVLVRRRLVFPAEVREKVAALLGRGAARVRSAP